MHQETSFRLQKDWLKSEFYSKRYVRLNTEVKVHQLYKQMSAMHGHRTSTGAIRGVKLHVMKLSRLVCC